MMRQNATTETTYYIWINGFTVIVVGLMVCVGLIVFKDRQNNDVTVEQLDETTSESDNGIIPQSSTLNVVDEEMETVTESELEYPDLQNRIQTDNLARFYSREVFIKNIVLQVGNKANESFNPWDLYMQNPAVRDKIRHTKLMRGEMQLTFRCNSTPMHYGGMIISYLPMQNRDTVLWRGSDDAALVAMSGLTHVTMNMTAAEQGIVAQMRLPYISSKSMGDVNEHFWKSLGLVFVRQFEPLRHANGGTSSISITVTASLHDLFQAGTTSHDFLGNTVVPQTITEAVTRKHEISDAAEAVAGIAGQMSKIPGLKPLAVPVEIAASAAGLAARKMGFSKPFPMQETILQTNGNVASGDGLRQGAPLTLNRQAQIAPVNTAKFLEDIQIEKLCEREFYIGKLAFNSQSEGTVLGSWNVDPTHFIQNVIDGKTVYHQPMFSYMAQLFKYWQGEMEYRIEVNASKTHGGSIRMTYDPVSLLADDGMNTTMNVIYQIGQQGSDTISCPMTQKTPFLKVTGMNAPGAGLLSSARKLKQYDSNGTITVSVYNRLTYAASASVSAPVEILVFARMRRAKFLVPTDRIMKKCIPFFANSFTRTDDGENDFSYSVDPAAIDTDLEYVKIFNGGETEYYLPPPSVWTGYKDVNFTVRMPTSNISTFISFYAEVVSDTTIEVFCRTSIDGWVSVKSQTLTESGYISAAYTPATGTVFFLKVRLFDNRKAVHIRDIELSEDIDVGVVPQAFSGTNPDLVKYGGGDYVSNIGLLMKRETVIENITFDNMDGDVEIDLGMSPLPLFPGEHSLGIHKTASGTKYNYVPMSYYTYLMPCFLGASGSVHNRFVFTAVSPPYNQSTAVLERIPEAIENYKIVQPRTTAGYTAGNAPQYLLATGRGPPVGRNGAHFVNLAHTNEIGATSPFYSNELFYSTRHGDNIINDGTLPEDQWRDDDHSQGDGGFGEGLHMYSFMKLTPTTNVLRWFAVGEDFLPMHFVSPPPVEFTDMPVA